MNTATAPPAGTSTATTCTNVGGTSCRDEPGPTRTRSRDFGRGTGSTASSVNRHAGGVFQRQGSWRSARDVGSRTDRTTGEENRGSVPLRSPGPFDSIRERASRSRRGETRDPRSTPGPLALFSMQGILSPRSCPTRPFLGKVCTSGGTPVVAPIGLPASPGFFEKIYNHAHSNIIQRSTSREPPGVPLGMSPA